MRAGRRRWCAAAALLAALPVMSADPPREIELTFTSDAVLRWTRGDRPVLVVRPEPGDGWLSIARRWGEAPRVVEAIVAANPSLRQPMRDRGVRVPFEILAPEVRVDAVQRLFAADRRGPSGWEHVVLDPFGGGEESWRWLAHLFTGGEEAARRLVGVAGGPAPARGTTVVVPDDLLLDAFRRVPAPATPTPTRTSTPTPAEEIEQEAGAEGALTYGRDRRGEYAVYRLRRGEALYSAVVVRFTGQLLAAQVNATAEVIADRSDIDDVTSIPVGHPIRIPLDLLTPEYLPAGHPRRAAWESEQRELARFLEVTHAHDLSGVHVIVDAGHGGADSGAVVNGVWEAPYVYDLACRVKDNLERHTRATVWMVRRDRNAGFTPSRSGRLLQDRDQVLLTRPPYDLEDSVIGVHLRWYLTNDIVLRRLPRGTASTKTVFLSIHADSLHPSVRGAMVYVPSRYMRPPTYRARHRQLERFQEYRDNHTVTLGNEFKARSEASSRYLAAKILDGLRRNGIERHPYEPVRDRILRGSRSYVPAVLRYTLAQHAVLVESCNLANEEDRTLILDADWRERFARSLVEGMAAAFGG